MKQPVHVQGTVPTLEMTAAQSQATPHTITGNTSPRHSGSAENFATPDANASASDAAENKNTNGTADTGSKGYGRLAALLARQDEYAIFRRFKYLNCLSLLYQQAEIIFLQDHLEELAAMDRTHSCRMRQFFDRDWITLAHPGDPESGQQWATMQLIQLKLAKYNKALLTQASLAKLNPPNFQDLTFLREWIGRADNGNYPIHGPDQHAWDPEFETDLMAISPRVPLDRLSRWVNDIIFPWYHKFFGAKIKDPEDAAKNLGTGIYIYSESHLQIVIETFVTVVAALLPVLSIVVLYFLGDNNKFKFMALVIFSAIFALALAIMTKAKRVEVFAATAAFAAVNVVFLSQDPTGEELVELMKQYLTGEKGGN
ncbi:uncharacterized protein QC763_512180 [Podospora pseudopauciseta]|uniref:DUF6594 domain-containing protein n=2 Tax=Podospora TaxID=5144 RepID=A0ABR0H9P5_9PEZI|nr:hypothetical protein QC763_512180 [Podospora pseudopauciseta]KAK4675742.1 hypothetical protein QC764_512180 [Podospora pseudoanserina]